MHLRDIQNNSEKEREKEREKEIEKLTKKRRKIIATDLFPKDLRQVGLGWTGNSCQAC